MSILSLSAMLFMTWQSGEESTHLWAGSVKPFWAQKTLPRGGSISLLLPPPYKKCVCFAHFTQFKHFTQSVYRWCGSLLADLWRGDSYVVVHKHRRTQVPAVRGICYFSSIPALQQSNRRRYKNLTVFVYLLMPTFWSHWWIWAHYL